MQDQIDENLEPYYEYDACECGDRECRECRGKVPTLNEIHAQAAAIRKENMGKIRLARTSSNPEMEPLSERVGSCVGRCHGCHFFTARGRVDL